MDTISAKDKAYQGILTLILYIKTYRKNESKNLDKYEAPRFDSWRYSFITVSYFALEKTNFLMRRNMYHSKSLISAYYPKLKTAQLTARNSNLNNINLDTYMNEILTDFKHNTKSRKYRKSRFNWTFLYSREAKYWVRSVTFSTCYVKI